MLNQREVDVLDILWQAGEPMIVTAIVEADKSNGLTQSTVTAVLRKLLKEELVEVCGVTHSGKVLSRTYRATEKSKEAVLNNFVEMYNASRNVLSLKELIAGLKKM